MVHDCRQGGDPAVLDPVTDLKLNQLEVVDSTNERQHLMQVSPVCPAAVLHVPVAVLLTPVCMLYMQLDSISHRSACCFPQLRCILLSRFCK